MSERELPESVRALLRRHVRSYHDLMVLLALCREAGGPLRAKGLADELALSTADVEQALDGLVERGLATCDNGGKTPAYRIRTATLTGEDVRVLRTAYDQQSVAVIRQVNLNAITRVRTGAARAFGDPAFGPPRAKRDDD